MQKTKKQTLNRLKAKFFSRDLQFHERKSNIIPLNSTADKTSKRMLKDQAV